MISHMTIQRQLAGAPAGATSLLDDLAWCWWTQPRATRIGDTLFVGGIASGGDVYAAACDLATGGTERFVLARLEPDDHNNPAIVAQGGKPLLASYSRHDVDGVLRFRASARADDVAEWGPERAIGFSAITTYAQAHAYGDEVHLFTRVGDTSWGYARSSDWGNSWSSPVGFVSIETDQETYMPTALRADGRTLRLAIAGHPKNYETQPWHEIRAAVVDLATGAVTRPSDGRELANLRRGTGLPVRGDQLELIYEAPAGRTLNLFDVSDGEMFEVAFATKVADDSSTEDAWYHVACGRGGTWEVEDVAPAGAKFGYIDAGFYVGGIVFPHATSGGSAYVSRESGGIWHLERWDRSKPGQWHPRAVFEPTAARVVRPWPVRNPDEGLEVVALLLDRYDDDYMETLSHLVGGAVRGEQAGP